ncbi:mannose-6-phosphate isomerase [Phlyctochytrium arcticum]|nr:mannose-6-phosphate isomerase [Phlyctochytrium arcticum]
MSIHRLECPTQSYDWGKVGNESKVAQLAQSSPGVHIESQKPYAELWMGTHTNAPSKLVDGGEPLKSILSPETLGAKIHGEYDGDLPFLFKILSIRKALSIQAHPDKTLAQKLHKEFPDVYKDPNHKPEMAIALTPFEAFINFKPLEEIKEHLAAFPEFRDLVGEEVATEFDAAVGKADEGKAALKKLFQALLEADAGKINLNLLKLITRLRASATPETGGSIEELVDRLNMQFPKDGGVFCAFLLNHVKLSPGEAIFLAANEPHAYLSGDCVECMAASDNVIRAGLTPKFKDVKTLVSSLTYKYGPADAQILRGEPYPATSHTTLYDPPIAEFSILQTKLAKGVTEKVKGVQGPSLVVVTAGKGVFKAGEKEDEVDTGFVYFIPADVDVELRGEGDEDFVTYRAFCV